MLIRLNFQLEMLRRELNIYGLFYKLQYCIFGHLGLIKLSLKIFGNHEPRSNITCFVNYHSCCKSFIYLLCFLRYCLPMAVRLSQTGICITISKKLRLTNCILASIQIAARPFGLAVAIIVAYAVAVFVTNTICTIFYYQLAC
jgi:hypothetical protein